MWTIYGSILVLVGIYFAVLLSLNLIPHVKVKSIRWMALYGIRIKIHNFRITIGRLGLKFNPSWSFNNPFRFLIVDFVKVQITLTPDPQTQDAKGLPEQEKRISPPELDTISLSIPNWAYTVLIKKGWLNEIGVHVSQFNLVQNSGEKDATFFVDYIKLENTCNLKKAKITFTVSALDGYLRQGSSECKDQECRLFHNWEVQASSRVTQGESGSGKTEFTFSEFKLLLIFGSLQIPELSFYLNRLKKKSASPKPRFSLKQEVEIARFDKVLSVLSLVSSIQIKVEQSLASYHDFKTTSSSYSLNFVKDENYKQETKVRLFSNVTSMEMFHLGLKCVEIPSLTHIFEIDLTDAYRAKKAGSKSFFIDASTTLSITNPILNVYFDQLNLYFDASAKRKNSQQPPQKKTSIDIEALKAKYSKFFSVLRAVSFKVAVVDLRGTLHMPEINTEKFERRAITNIVTKAELKAFSIKSSSKNLSALLKQRELKAKHNIIKSYLKIKNLSIDVEKNALYLSSCNALVTYCVEKSEISLNIRNKRLWIKSVNTMIFHIIRRIREARITHKNSECARLNDEQYMKEVERISIEKRYQKELLDLFSLLPASINSIRFRSSYVLAYIICNDVLPAFDIHVKALDDMIDLGQIKRGVSVSTSELNCFYGKDAKEMQLTLKDIEANTLSDSSSEYSMENERTDSDSDINDLSSIDSDMNTSKSFNFEREVNIVKQVLTIPDLCLANVPGESSRISLSFPEIDAKLDIFLIWCVLYAQTLLEIVAPRIGRTYTKEQAQQLEIFLKYLLFDVHVTSMAIVASIPHNVDILFELDHLSFTDVLNAPECQLNHFRLYCVNPGSKLWSRLVTISDFSIDLKAATELSIPLTSKTVRLNIPFQFLVYTVIDNLITMAKAAKQIRVNFKRLSEDLTDFSSLPVKVMQPLKLPRIQWKTKTFGLSLENDTFETELAIIFELGMIEQIERKRKYAMFDIEAQKRRAKAADKLSKSDPGSRRFLSHRKTRGNATKKISEIFNRTHLGFCHAHSSGSKDNHADTSPSLPIQEESPENTHDEDYEDFYTEETAEEEINLAHERLLEDFSSSWIHKYQVYKRAKLKLWQERSQKTWGPDEILEIISRKYAIQKFAPGPPQMYVIFKDFDLTIDDPRLPDVHDFLHKYGKGTPKLDYSILVPASLHLTSSFVYAGAKDYLLPILSFPANSDPTTPVFDFKGTLVINEKLVALKEELRRIYIPFSPAVADTHLENNFYGSDVIRTLTPVKCMFNFETNLTTDRACIVSWNKSYQPTLLNAMLALDNFTKPEIDDSPLGWWDKLALNAHGKMKFNIKNELCLHIKSSLSPYALTGENSGFVFSWKDNVLLKINDSNNPQEFLLLESDDFILGIPNYSLPERGSWSLLYADLDEYTANDELESRKFQKEVMKLTSDEKVVWRLGVLFERNEDKHQTELGADIKRTNEFKKHWDVCVTGPMYDYHPDSFEEFRSDYVHLAVSVTSNSKQGNSYNYAYFTPMTLKYFFVWWNTLTESVSLPIREGPLFSRETKKSSSVKFGPHLFTFKYQLILEPFIVSHMILSSSGQETNHRVIGTGIKAKASSCVIDLHQRREVARYINTKLNIDKTVRKLKMNSGEIDVSDADIRLIHAQFRDISLSGKLLSYFTGESNVLIDVDLFANERQAVQSTSPRLHFFKSDSQENLDFLWIDLEDFIELEYGEILSPDPVVKVIPFLLNPKLNYYREFTLEDPRTPYPFGNEASHTCRIGSNSPKKVQTELLSRKILRFKTRIEESESAIKAMDASEPSNSSRINSLRDLIELDKAKLDKYQLIYESISDEPASVKSQVLDTESEDVASLLNKASTHSESLHENISYIEAASEVSRSKASCSDYHNRFLIHNLRMIWNNQVKEVFTSFLSLVGDRRSIYLSLSSKAVKLVENILKNLPEDEPIGKHRPVTKQKLKCGNDVVQAFESYLNHIASKDQELDRNYLVKFFRPQIQLRSNVDPSSCTILAANDIELRIACLNHEGTSAIIHEDSKDLYLVETRHGVLFQDTYIFSFNKEEYQESVSQPSSPYSGETEVWPPWIDVEDCDEPNLKKNLVVDKTTMALSMTKPNMLSLEAAERKVRSSEIIVHLAKLVVNATSIQYSAIYYVLTDLLMGGKQAKNFLRERIKQITAVSDMSEFINATSKLKSLQENIKACRRILLKINEYAPLLSNFHQRERDYLRLEIEKMKIELTILIRSIEYMGSKSSTKAAMTNWSLIADQIIFHLLEDNREPLVDLALASSRFTRVDAHDGSNWNKVEVQMMQGFNLKAKSVYPVLLSPLLDQNNLSESPAMIKMCWRMLSPVGGIRVMSNAELAIQPLHVQLDYETATELFSYLFPKDQKEDLVETPDSSFDDYSDQDSISFESESSSGVPSSQFKNTFRKLLRKRDDGSDMTSEHTRSIKRHNLLVYDSAASGDTHSRAHSRQDSKPDSKQDSKQDSKAESSVHSRSDSKTNSRSDSKFSKGTGSSRWQRSKNSKAFNKEHSDDVLVIMDRSSTYFVVGEFLIAKFNLCLSFKAPKHLNIIDVHNLTLSIPRIHYRDKTWSSHDFASQLQKDIVKIVLAHTGKIIGNKFRHRRREETTTPLKQVANYSQFMTVDELQMEGRERESPEQERKGGVQSATNK